MSERPPELEITIDEAAFEDAVAQFTASCMSLFGDHIVTLAMRFQEQCLASICVQWEGRPVRVTMKRAVPRQPGPEARP